MKKIYSCLFNSFYSKFRKFIKNQLNLYDIEDLQVGGHCGCCGVWIPNEILPKIWAVGICEKCLRST